MWSLPYVFHPLISHYFFCQSLLFSSSPVRLTAPLQALHRSKKGTKKKGGIYFINYFIMFYEVQCVLRSLVIGWYFMAVSQLETLASIIILYSTEDRIVTV